MTYDLKVRAPRCQFFLRLPTRRSRAGPPRWRAGTAIGTGRPSPRTRSALGSVRSHDHPKYAHARALLTRPPSSASQVVGLTGSLTDNFAALMVFSFRRCAHADASRCCARTRPSPLTTARVGRSPAPAGQTSERLGARVDEPHSAPSSSCHRCAASRRVDAPPAPFPRRAEPAQATGRRNCCHMMLCVKMRKL